MNNYLFYTNASKGEKATTEEKDYVRNHAKSQYDMVVKSLEESNTPSQVDRKIEEVGKDAVFESGYYDGRYPKLIIIKYHEFDCYGDKYEAPLICYADNQYDYYGLTEESLRSYLQGYNFLDIAAAAAGGMLLVSEEIAMEDIANKLVNEPRTFTLKPLPKKK